MITAAAKLTLISIILFQTLGCSKKSRFSSSESFKFNLPVPVYNTDPQLTRGTASNYFLFNLHRGLFFYNSENILSPWGAKKCTWVTELKLVCKLADRYWSDGSRIKAEHYLNSFKTIFISKNRQLEYLKNIKGFDEYLDNESDQIGISAPSKNKLVFTFSRKDQSFLSKLSNQVFVPRKHSYHYKNESKDILYSGPYKLLKISTSRILMTNNQYFNDFPRPNVEALFVDESQAALNMYESKKIDFLRMLPSQEISNPKYSKIIYKSFLSRLDGVVLSHSLVKDINLRKALTHSLDFQVLKKIFASDSDPGCPPLPEKYFSNSKTPCYVFDLKKAKESLKKVGYDTINKSKLTIYVPKIETNDHQKMAEWAQENWKQNLGIKVNIEQLESKVLLNLAAQNKIGIFRKGFNLQRLGCFEALENFKSDSASNFIGFKSKDFDEVLSSKRTEEFSSKDCTRLFNLILKKYLWIPTGRFYFSHLHSTQYTGYSINNLNQFDLSRLQLRKGTK